MSKGLIDALAGGLGSVAGAGLGEIAGGFLGIDPSIAEAIGGALGGGLGTGLTSKSVLGGLAGAAGGALAGPAVLGGVEGLVGGNLSNLFGPGVGVGGAGAPLSLGGVTPTAAPSAGPLSGGAGPSAAAIGGGTDFSTDPNAIYSGPPGTAYGGNVDNTYGVTGQVLNPTGGAGTGLGAFLSQNKNWLLPAAGLGISAIEGNQQTQAQKAQSALAAQQQGYAGQLEQPLITGVLPAGAQAQVQQSLESQEAAIRSQFANMGLTGSTMETEALNSARQSSVAQTFQIASNMASQGLAAAGQAGNLDASMVQQQLAQDQALQQAIAGFAAASAGGGYYPGYSPYGYAFPQQQPVG